MDLTEKSKEKAKKLVIMGKTSAISTHFLIAEKIQYSQLMRAQIQ